MKKGVLKYFAKFTRKHLWNTFFTEQLRTTASGVSYYTFFYKQPIFDRRPKNCLGFSKKLPQKIVEQLFSRSINFYCLNIQTF